MKAGKQEVKPKKKNNSNNPKTSSKLRDRIELLVEETDVQTTIYNKLRRIGIKGKTIQEIDNMIIKVLGE